MNTSDHVQLMDTTLRDGEQTRDVSFSTSEKVSIAGALLSSLRVDRIEVASAAVSEGEKEAVTRITEWATTGGCVDRVEILGFVDERRSVDWIVSTGARVMNLLTKGSERHCRMQLRKTREQHLEDRPYRFPRSTAQVPSRFSAVACANRRLPLTGRPLLAGAFLLAFANCHHHTGRRTTGDGAFVERGNETLMRR